MKLAQKNRKLDDASMSSKLPLAVIGEQDEEEDLVLQSLNSRDQKEYNELMDMFGEDMVATATKRTKSNKSKKFNMIDQLLMQDQEEPTKPKRNESKLTG